MPLDDADADILGTVEKLRLPHRARQALRRRERRLVEDEAIALETSPAR
jgi:hypothetical protein